jgi:Tfp pilus assembly protein PilO
MTRLIERLTRRERTVLIWAGVLIALVVYGVLVVDPMQKNLSALKREFDREQVKVANARSIAKTESEMDASLATIERELLELERKIPSEQESSRFFLYVARAEQDSGVKVESVKPADPTAVKDFKQYPIKMIVRGPYPEMARFIFKVENYANLVRMQSFRAVPVSGPAGSAAATGVGWLSCEMTVLLFTSPSNVLTPQEEAILFRIPSGRPNPFYRPPAIKTGTGVGDP